MQLLIHAWYTCLWHQRPYILYSAHGQSDQLGLIYAISWSCTHKTYSSGEASGITIRNGNECILNYRLPMSAKTGHQAFLLLHEPSSPSLARKESTNDCCEKKVSCKSWLFMAIILRLISPTFFSSWFKFDGNIIFSCTNTYIVIVTRFSPWHNNNAAMVCATIFCNLMKRNNLHWN